MAHHAISATAADSASSAGASSAGKDKVDANGSTRSIYAALAGNIGVCAAKLAGYGLSGSSSMLVEALHSALDTVNQGLLLFGLHRSRKPADAKHPFGYGLEAYFWTLLVGLLIFFVGGVASIYEGALKVLHPSVLDHVGLTLVILVVCIGLDSAALVFALRQSDRTRPDLARRAYPRATLYQFVHLSPDPGVFEVLAEDAASLLGLLIAVLGVIAAASGWRWADGVAAIAIGIVLLALAGVILAETKSLLTGEAASPALLESLAEIIARHREVQTIRRLRSINLGPHAILLAAGLEVRPNMTFAELTNLHAALLGDLNRGDQRVRTLLLDLSAP